MAEAKTIRVKRCAAHPTCYRFDDPHGKLHVWVTREYASVQELEITITPVKSSEERLREARRPIAALAESWRETARGHMSMAGGDRRSAHINMAIECDQKAAELEAAIAAQVEVWETDGLATVARCIADLT